MSKRQKILVAIFVGASMLLSVLSLYFYQTFFTPNLLIKQEDRYLYIKPGTTFQELSQQLSAENFVNEKIPFMFASKVLGYQEQVKPGRYLIKANSTNLKAIRKLRSGAQDPVKVTFNNIRLRRDLAGRITRHLMADSATLLGMLNDPAVAARYQTDTANIISLFIPNTYEMYWNTSESELLERMYKEYNKFWTQERKDRAAQIGFTPQQVSILASIVEAETKKRDEAPTIAGVYINRLNQQMPLQADPTVVFAIGDFSIKRLFYKHLEYDSPYNTYLYTGLPPGPINLPSVPAIEAVLNYEKHKFLFFCAREDFSGYHAFAENLQEHNQNAARYRKALDKAGIK
jgi:UPF0755 protein